MEGFIIATQRSLQTMTQLKKVNCLYFGPEQLQTFVSSLLHTLVEVLSKEFLSQSDFKTGNQKKKKPYQGEGG